MEYWFLSGALHQRIVLYITEVNYKKPWISLGYAFFVWEYFNSTFILDIRFKKTNPDLYKTGADQVMANGLVIVNCLYLAFIRSFITAK